MCVKWYLYDADGNIPQTPDFDKIFNNTLFQINTKYASDVDFVTEIEHHSPIRVYVEERGK